MSTFIITSTGYKYIRKISWCKFKDCSHAGFRKIQRWRLNLQTGKDNTVKQPICAVVSFFIPVHNMEDIKIANIIPANV